MLPPEAKTQLFKIPKLDMSKYRVVYHSYPDL